MRVKTVTVVLAFLLSGLIGNWAAAEKVPSCRGDLEPTALEVCLVALNSSLFREVMIHGDREALEQASFPEALLVVVSGVERMRESEDVSSLPKVDSLKVENEQTVVSGDTAVLAGTLMVEGRMAGRPLPPRLRYLSVFARSGEEWRLLARSLLPVPSKQ